MWIELIWLELGTRMEQVEIGNDLSDIQKRYN
jgi:hypothetical protein